MNIMMKTLLSAAALTTFTGVAHAGERSHCDTGSGAVCAATIPVELVVPKSCDLVLDDSKITLDSTGAGSRSFKIGANYAYNLLVNTDYRVSDTQTKLTSGSNTVTTNVTTQKGGSGPNIPLGTIQTGIAAPTGYDNYTVSFQTAENFAMKPAGTYMDNYHITVSF
ncbi:hypothetical protein [Acinetobacter sp. ANC 4639]